MLAAAVPHETYCAARGRASDGPRVARRWWWEEGEDRSNPGEGIGDKIGHGGETGESHAPKLRTTVREVALYHDIKITAMDKPQITTNGPDRSQVGPVRRR